MISPWAILLIISGTAGSYIARKLTLFAALAGGCIAGLCYLGAGFTGIGMLGAFFIMASVATSFKFKQKQAAGFSEGIKGRRTSSQVISNGGVAAFLCGLGFVLPGYQPVFQLLAAASLSAAAADSVSSETGNAFGSSFFNILSLKKDQKGLDGVISPEGTFAGLVASVVVSVIYSLGAGWSTDIVYIIAGGTAGNLFDSLLGAGFERKLLLTNNMVNFFNTVFGALFAYVLMLIFG